MNAIEVKHISKSYGRVCALDDVSFEVSPGELFGLIGPDGAGKTTLFRILTTLKDADKGSATVDGYDVQRQYRDIRRVVGYMPGRFSLYSDLSVAENLEFFAALFGVTVQANYDLIAPIYDQIAPFANRRAGKLSGGMKQKLALCCALIHKPSVLFLDEPTTGVDAVSREEFWQMLSHLKSQGISILASTPYMDEVQKCDRVALIEKGRIHAVDTPERLAAGVGDNLYEARAREKWPLLQHLRHLLGVEYCYTFGAVHHVVAAPDFDPDEACRSLTAAGLHDVRIEHTAGNIEDLFIKIMRNGQQQ